MPTATALCAKLGLEHVREYRLISCRAASRHRRSIRSSAHCASSTAPHWATSSSPSRSPSGASRTHCPLFSPESRFCSYNRRAKSNAQARGEKLKPSILSQKLHAAGLIVILRNNSQHNVSIEPIRVSNCWAQANWGPGSLARVPRGARPNRERA
jgi:hypothetical protein